MLHAFCQGLLASHTHAFFFLYLKTYEIDVIAYSLIESVISILLLLNPLYGFVTDRFKLFGRHKQSYLVVCGVVGSLIYFLVAMTAYRKISLGVIIAAHFLVDINNAFRTVVIDSICVISHKFHNEKVTSKKEKSTNSSLMLLYGSRVLGRVISVGFFGAVYNRFQNKYFFFVMGVAMTSMIISLFTKDPPLPSEPPQSSFKANVKESFEVIKKNRFVGLLLANGLAHASPEIEIGFHFFLISALNFSNSDFALKSLTTEMFLLLGVFLMGTLFKKTKRSLFLKICFLAYALWTLLLVYVLRFSEGSDEASPIVLVLSFTGVQALLEELRTVPVVGVFLEFSPKSQEGFFISLIYFFNSFSDIVSHSLGSLFVYLLSIKKDNFAHLPYLVLIHVLFALVSFVILTCSHVPDKLSQKKTQAVQPVTQDGSTFAGLGDAKVTDASEPDEPRPDVELTNLLDEDQFNEQVIFKDLVGGM